MKKRIISMCLALALLWSLFVNVPMKANATSVDGWVAEEGKWYYYQDNVKVTGWLEDGGFSYYLDETGAMVTGWLKEGDNWHYFNTSGAMVTGWLRDGGNWYYLDENGVMVTGWLQDGDNLYYFNASGVMVTGRGNIDGAWHRFNTSGVWQGTGSSTEMVEILKTIEGFSAKPYKDNTQWSVGYGTRCPDDKFDEYMANGISQQEAQALLEQMLEGFESAVRQFAQRYDLTLQQHQFDALVMFSYNCGTSWTSETTGYFHNAVKNGSTGTDFLYAICLWSSSAGRFILTERRLSEANMYINGVYEAWNRTEDGTYPETFKYVYMDGNGGSVNYIMHAYDAADSSQIITQVTAPDGYEFAGWYTESIGGTKVEVLDGSLENGVVLFAQWQDSNGQIVSIPKGTPCVVKVKVIDSVNVRTGPGTYYPKAQDTQLAVDTELIVTQTYTYSGDVWGKTQYGWVSLEYTNYESVLAGEETWPRTGTVTTDDVNVRSGPGTSNPRQYQLSTGAAVKIYEKTSAEGLTWGRLEDGNWICLSYVKLDPVYQTGWVQVGADWYYVKSSGGVATGWESINGAWYYFDANGVMQTGWLEQNGLHYLTASGAMVTGWWKIDGAWHFFDANGIMQTGWLDAGYKYYLTETGVMVTGWQDIENGRYYFDANGVMQTGWLLDGSTWYYMNSSGAMVTGIYTIDGVKHEFNSSGVWLGEVKEVQKNGWELDGGIWYYYKNNVKVTGWLQLGGVWYYMGADGAMVTGWQYVHGAWYYMNSSGAMVTGTVTIGDVQHKFNSSGVWLGEVQVPKKNGWLYESGAWYYYKNDVKATGWLLDGGTWYYLNDNGAMTTGWLWNGYAWYYMNSSGAMATGWVRVGGTWYYMNSSGAMVTGWLWDGYAWYYLYDSGAMATNISISGGWIDSSGVWHG